MNSVGDMEGYDADFDPPLEKRLECPICLLAQRDPMQTPCGHRFCGPCLHRAIHVTGPKCPVDNQRIRVTQLFRDNFARREVLSLSVRCRSREKGCEWSGELRALEDHKKNCPFEEISCPNGCGLTALRKVVNFHTDDCPKRWVSCELCNLYVQYDGMEFHVSMCNKIILSPCQPAVTQKVKYHLTRTSWVVVCIGPTLCVETCGVVRWTWVERCRQATNIWRRN
jgi:TNF receptor-associated factor 6